MEDGTRERVYHTRLWCVVTLLLALLLALMVVVGWGSGWVLAAKDGEGNFVPTGAPSTGPGGPDRRLDTETPTATPTITPTPTCDLAWHVVGSVQRAGDNYLNGVTALAANDVWAVGWYSTTSILPHTMIQHWDGTQWVVIPSANIDWGYQRNFLNSVSAISATDIWAVGSYDSTFPNKAPDNATHNLIEHWNGTNWSTVPSPDGAINQSLLYGVTAIAPDDVWAVGIYYDSDYTFAWYPFLEHWDGSQWSLVSSPNASIYGSFLYDVDAISSTDVWAVGYYYTARTGSYALPLAVHWDGTQWNLTSPAPPTPNSDYFLTSVTAVSANDVWSAGYSSDGSTQETFIEHWDGAQWSVVSSPNPAGSNSQLQAISGLSPTDVWAVGHYNIGGGPYHSLAERWDGAQWSIVSSPDAGGGDNNLVGVVSIAGDDAWAVGSHLNSDGGQIQTLTEHYSDICPNPTVTPTSTSTPTITPTPGPKVFGHLTWQNVQAANRPSVTGTLTLCVSGTPHNFGFTTNTSGNFTVTVDVPDGTYHWRVKGGRHLSTASPANGADLVISGGVATQEFGLQRGGDANVSNNVSVIDFHILRERFGGPLDGFAEFNHYIDGGSVNRAADFDYNLVVNSSDFNILKSNFGLAGNPLICP